MEGLKMLKITLKLDNIVYTELMYEKEFELLKLTNKYVEILNVERLESQ
jgi:hypothetical protein